MVNPLSQLPTSFSSPSLPLFFFICLFCPPFFETASLCSPGWPWLHSTPLPSAPECQNYGMCHCAWFPSSFFCPGSGAQIPLHLGFSILSLLSLLPHPTSRSIHSFCKQAKSTQSPIVIQWEMKPWGVRWDQLPCCPSLPCLIGSKVKSFLVIHMWHISAEAAPFVGITFRLPFLESWDVQRRL